jgi:c-di-GMP-binding flagellar brake protein YcgR
MRIVKGRSVPDQAVEPPGWRRDFHSGLARILHDVAPGSSMVWEEQLMTRLLDERRKCVRVSMVANAYWRCGGRSGRCQLVDVSPGGAALVVSLRDVFQLEAYATLDVELETRMEWRVTDKAEVIRRILLGERACKVGVAFPTAEYD